MLENTVMKGKDLLDVWASIGRQSGHIITHMRHLRKFTMQPSDWLQRFGEAYLEIIEFDDKIETDVYFEEFTLAGEITQATGPTVPYGTVIDSRDTVVVFYRVMTPTELLTV